MNNIANFEAYKSFYGQGKEAYNRQDFDMARKFFTKAAEIANNISKTSSSYTVKIEYYEEALRILNFLKNDFDKKQIVTNTGTDKKTENTIEPILDDENKITFDDVAGLDEVKDEIRFNVIEPLNNPDLAKSYNINPGAKILLYGLPGTGKTFIARAIAGEIDAKFYAVNCQDLISKFMGESSKLIDQLFETAQQNKRAIIFFDEFDSVASKRESDVGSVDAEMSRFVSTFLTKVDGFKKPKDCEMLLLIAATNRPWAIDSAMLRGGRFDTHIYVDLPDEAARVFLINKEFKGIELKDFDVQYLANKLDGYGGADIVSTCRKIKQLAYRRAIKSGKFEAISQQDVDMVLSELKPSISDYDIAQFEAFKKGQI